MSNHKNVSNHRPLPYFGDEWLAKESTLHKLNHHWLEAATGMELSDPELWYMYIGHGIWVKQLGMMIVGLMKHREQVSNDGMEGMNSMQNSIPLDKRQIATKPSHYM